jgi:hypothetical protein
LGVAGSLSPGRWGGLRPPPGRWGWITATPWPDLFFFFFFGFAGDKNGHWGGRISLPLAVGVDRGHPQWPDLSFFFFFFAGKVAGEGGGWRRLFAGGGRRWWRHLGGYGWLIS